MNESSLMSLDSAIATAARGLFEQLGVEASVSSGVPGDEHDVACSIGFASSSFRGSLTLTAHEALVAASRPAEVRRSGDATETDIADWMGELGNQLLGRLKNRLISHGVAIELGTPAVLSGFRIRRRAGKLPVSREFQVVSDHGSLAVHLDAHAECGFELDEENADMAVMPEGELALF